MEIQVLIRQGKSIREVARCLGVSRNTVRRHLRVENSQHYKARARRPGKLEPFMAYLQQRIREAHPHWLPANAGERR